jgi:hypothetical protein
MPQTQRRGVLDGSRGPILAPVSETVIDSDFQALGITSQTLGLRVPSAALAAPALGLQQRAVLWL